jgi:hypothetical protein
MVADGTYRSGLRTLFAEFFNKMHFRADLEAAEASV